MTIERYDIANTCGGHCWQATQAADGEFVYAADHAADVRVFTAAVRDLLDGFETLLRAEFGETRFCADMLAELQPYRDLLAAVEGGAA